MDVVIDQRLLECYRDLQLKRKYQYLVFDLKKAVLSCIKKCPGSKHPKSKSPTAWSPRRRHQALLEYIKTEKLNEGCIIVEDLPNKNKIVFVLWTPATAPAREKVMYSTAANKIMQSFDGIHRNIHCSELDELELDQMEKHLLTPSPLIYD